ncbi:MAG: fluoride efflux transporter CrcB [Planctomycetes bacterium]|nr:fluoride efflux transporter CrcB [Planctomycetota bacterium]
MGSFLIQTGWIGLGGAIGSMLRFAAAGGAQRLIGAERMPVGTMFVNVVGCVAIGFLSVRMEGWTIGPHLRLALTVGVLGGFTTFSSFSLNTIQLLFERHFFLAAMNIVGSVVLCLAGCWLGFRIARALEAATI